MNTLSDIEYPEINWICTVILALLSVTTYDSVCSIITSDVVRVNLISIHCRNLGFYMEPIFLNILDVCPSSVRRFTVCHIIDKLDIDYVYDEYIDSPDNTGVYIPILSSRSCGSLYTFWDNTFDYAYGEKMTDVAAYNIYHAMKNNPDILYSIMHSILKNRRAALQK